MTGGTRVAEIEPSTAIPFIKRWHYSGCATKGDHRYFGWYVGDDLYAVDDYGLGVNPYQASGLTKLTGVTIHPFELVELKRLCRTEPRRDPLQLTQFLAECHRRLAEPGVRYVVAFSDPARGHTGGIYRAAGFRHLGVTKAEFHAVDGSGAIHHRRVYYRHARRRGIDMATARAELGLRLVKTLPKDRWFGRIG